MLTITASAAARASASTSPIRGSSASQTSAPSGRICAGTRSAVVLRMWVTPSACSASRRSALPARSLGGEVDAGHEVQEVLPRPLRAPLAEARRARGAGCRRRPSSPRRPRARARARGPAEVAMLTRLWVLELTKYSGRSVVSPRRRARRSPAPTSGASCGHSRCWVPPSMRMRSARRSRATSGQALGEALAPRLVQPRPVLGTAAQQPRALLGRRAHGRPRLLPSPRRAGARGSCSIRSGRRRASAAGHRRRRRWPAAPPSVPRPSSYQRRRRAGASASCQDVHRHAGGDQGLERPGP